MRNPRWPLYLGRKAFVPAEPVWLADGMSELPLLDALKSYPWLGHDESVHTSLRHLRVLIDDSGGAIVRYDQPISFRWDQRRYAPRRVKSLFIPRPLYRKPFSEEEEM